MRPTRTAEQTAALVTAYHAAQEAMGAAIRHWSANGRPMSPFATIRTCPVLAACRAALVSCEALVSFDHIVYEHDSVLHRVETEAEAERLAHQLRKAGRKGVETTRWLAGEPWTTERHRGLRRHPDWQAAARRVAGVA